MEKKYLQNATDLGHFIGSLFPDLGNAKGVAIVRTLFNGIAHSLYDQVQNGVTDPHVQIQGFGSTRVIERQPRKARNPKTGDQIELGKRLVLRWTPSDNFKTALNDPKEGHAYFKALPLGLGTLVPDPVSSKRNGTTKAFNQLEFSSMDGVERIMGRSRNSVATTMGGAAQPKRGPGRPKKLEQLGGGSSKTTKPTRKAVAKKKATAKKTASKATSKKTSTARRRTPNRGNSMGGGSLIDLNQFLQMLAQVQTPTRRRKRRTRAIA